MNKKQKPSQTKDPAIAVDTVLAPVSRNWMKRGDKIRMKDGEILTVKWLEDRDFICEEKVGYIPKIHIDTIME